VTRDLAELDVKPDTIKHAVARGRGKVFAFLPGDGAQRVGLIERKP
jgi:hypothetical protein